MISQLEVLMNQEYKLSPNKIREISRYGYFLEAHSLRRVSGETVHFQKKFPHHEIRSNFHIFMCL